MIRRLLVRWLVLALAVGVACWLVPAVQVSGGVLGLLGVALLYGLVNAVVGTVLRILTAPLTIVTVGLSLLLVNAVLLIITAWFSDVLTVGGLLPSILAALIISIVGLVLHVATGDTKRARKRSA